MGGIESAAYGVFAAAFGEFTTFGLVQRPGDTSLNLRKLGSMPLAPFLKRPQAIAHNLTSARIFAFLHKLIDPVHQFRRESDILGVQ